MNSMQLRRFTLIILLSTAYLSVAGAEEPRDYYSPDNVRKFADFLYEEGDYLRAAGEYQRYLFYQPRESDQIHYKIARCYRLGGQSEKAIQLYETFLQVYPDSPLASGTYYQIGVSYFFMEQYEESVSYLDATLPSMADVRHRTASQELIGLSYLMQKQWLEADKIFNVLQESDVAAVRERATVYRNYAVQGRNCLAAVHF